MTLKEIYERYGVSEIFNNEVMKIVKDNPKNFSNVIKVFDNIVDGIEYLKNLLNVSVYKIIMQLDEIPLDVVNTYLLNDYSWLRVSKIVKKLDSQFMLNLLLVKGLVFSFPHVVNEINLRVLNSFLLANDVGLSVLLEFLNVVEDKVKLSYEVCEKYLDKDYSWLRLGVNEDNNIINKLNIQYVLKVFFINKQILKYRETASMYFDEHTEWNMVFNNFLLQNDVDTYVFLVFLKETFCEISFLVLDKYLTRDYEWLNDYEVVQKVDINFLFKVLFIDQKIFDYKALGMYLDKDKVYEFLRQNKVSENVLTLINSDLLYLEKIPDDVGDAYLTTTYFWLNNPVVIEKLSTSFLLKVLFIKKQIIKFPNLIDKVKIEEINNYLLSNTSPLEAILALIKLPNYKLPLELYNKYLLSDFSYLNDEEVVKRLNIDFLFKVLLIDKQILNFPNALHVISDAEIFQYILNHDIEQSVLNIVVKKFDYDFLLEYFNQNREEIINNSYYKKVFFTASGVISNEIVSDSLLSKDYDEIIIFIKNNISLSWMIPDKEEILEEEKEKILVIYREYNNLEEDIKETFRLYAIAFQKQ